ncbi:MAG TPA: GNAT family N-acetyltransferase [Bryobacteraceae bacterium]|nr:GNAT family N-acetyltransferase [Bryobacteraceae bacterium]
MNPRYRFRPGTLDDLAIILRHRTAMFGEMGFTDPALLDDVVESAEPYFRQAVADGSYRAYLVETEAGEVIAGGGLLIAAWPGFPGERQSRRAWILNMYTEPAHRRRGIAKQIVQMIVDVCRVEGFTAVALHASNDGRPLYESLGFRPTNEMRLRFG